MERKAREGQNEIPIVTRAIESCRYMPLSKIMYSEQPSLPADKCYVRSNRENAHVFALLVTYFIDIF